MDQDADADAEKKENIDNSIVEQEKQETGEEKPEAENDQDSAPTAENKEEVKY